MLLNISYFLVQSSPLLASLYHFILRLPLHFCHSIQQNIFQLFNFGFSPLLLPFPCHFIQYSSVTDNLSFGWCFECPEPSLFQTDRLYFSSDLPLHIKKNLGGIYWISRCKKISVCRSKLFQLMLELRVHEIISLFLPGKLLQARTERSSWCHHSSSSALLSLII